MFCVCGSLCGSSIRPLDPSKVPSVPQNVLSVVQDVSAVTLDVSSSVQDVSAVTLDVSSSVQDVSSSEFQDVSAVTLDVSSAQEDEPCPIDLSGTDQIIEKIDEILHEIPVRHAEDPVESAIAKLWLPPKDRVAAALGSPMTRATTRG